MRREVAHPLGLALEQAELAAGSANGLVWLETERPGTRRLAIWSLVAANTGRGLTVATESLTCLIALRPVLIFSKFYLLNRELVSLLFTDPVVWCLVAIAITLQLLGFLWVRQLVTTEP